MNFDKNLGKKLNVMIIRIHIHNRVIHIKWEAKKPEAVSSPTSGKIAYLGQVKAANPIGSSLKLQCLQCLHWLRNAVPIFITAALHADMRRLWVVFWGN